MSNTTTTIIKEIREEIDACFDLADTNGFISEDSRIFFKDEVCMKVADILQEVERTLLERFEKEIIGEDEVIKPMAHETCERKNGFGIVHCNCITRNHLRFQIRHRLSEFKKEDK